MNKLDTGRGGLHQILEPIMLPETTNIKFFQRENTDEQPLLYISKDKTYFEILGHRVETGENMNSMEDLSKWLQHIKEVEEENKRLKKEIDEYENKRAYLIDYLCDKVEEAKLERTYINGMIFKSMKEQIYIRLLDIVEGKDDEGAY